MQLIKEDLKIRKVAYSWDMCNSWYEKLKGCENEFRNLDLYSLEYFLNVCETSDVLLEVKDYGYARLTHLQVGRSARLHGAFWSSKVIKDLKNVRKGILDLMYFYDLFRLEVVTPTSCRGLGRFLTKLGFLKEGTLRKTGMAGKLIFNQDVYSIIRDGGNYE